MAEISLLPVRLLQDYGRLAMPVFYPSFNVKKVTTCRSVIDLYKKCLEYKDVEALQLLSEQYDIERIMSFDLKYAVECPINIGRTKYELNQYTERCRKYRIKENPIHRVGGQRFHKYFRIDHNNQVICSARKIIYNEMSSVEVETLIKMSASDEAEQFDCSKASLVEKFEFLYSLPDRDELFLFFLRFTCNQEFPIDDWERLRDGTFRIIDKIEGNLPYADIPVDVGAL